MMRVRVVRMRIVRMRVVAVRIVRMRVVTVRIVTVRIVRVVRAPLAVEFPPVLVHIGREARCEAAEVVSEATVIGDVTVVGVTVARDVFLSTQSGKVFSNV